ncbi:reverse transcriptase domain-containing protein [Tanacetum coccineum]
MEKLSFDLNVRKESSDTDEVAQYSGNPKSITFEIHHGGCFTPTPNRSYVGGQITILKTNTPYPSRRYGVSVPALTKDHRRLKTNTPYPEDSIRTESRLRPYHFNYPERSLTMEEMLNKFIDEGKREHEEMRAFIYDFQTNNELLFKERNNSLIELRFGVQELLNVINNVPMIDCEVKGVTTRGGKTTTQDVHNNDTNGLPKEPVITNRSVVQPSNEVQPPPVPFPKRLRKEKDEAQQKKFLENLKQLHINLPFIEAIAQMPNSNDKNGSDSENSIRHIDSINTPYPVLQGTSNGDNVKCEHLYSASTNEIDEKKSELKNLPQHLEYVYLHGDKSFPIIISSELSENEKNHLCNSWVSPIHVVPKRGGMTVVLNDNNELIPSRTVTGWRVCIDYRKLNDATRKDHFPLPFIDQMLEYLCGNEYYYFLDGFSGLFQIPIAPEDQEKTTFTYPYRTFAYRRMPFGLCNAPATFQRCMTAIFHDMVEDFMEVFIDDFSVFEEIVLGHKIFGAGIEVDRAKIDVIAKLPYSTNVKGLLMKDAKFDFSDDCKKAFNILKEKLTTAPIIISPDWNEPFELMCDASDFAVEAILGQRIDGKFKPIYYASKTLNNAQEHYTTTEKELLAVVFSFDKFRQYLVLSKTVVYTDHSAVKYLFSKEDAKPRIINHLSRLENPDLGTLAKEEITDEFPDEHRMILKAELNNDEP